MLYPQVQADVTFDRQTMEMYKEDGEYLALYTFFINT